MTDPGTSSLAVSDHVADHIADMLLTLSDVGDGNFDVQLDLKLPEHHPLGALSMGINQMTRALAQERRDAVKLQRELEEKLAVIERQRDAMRELSTPPLIEVWEGVLCMPVVGVIDTVRSGEMTDSLLHAVAVRSVECVIVDITSIDVMDTRTAQLFLRMSSAVRLLGARCMLSGISPNIAQTIVHMGVDLPGVEFHRTLRDALKVYLALDDGTPLARLVQ